MANANRYQVDQLAKFEHEVRSQGVWADTSVHDTLAHKFIARNPNSMLAISLCAQIVKSIDKLHENTISKHCLVCELFDIRKEVNNQSDQLERNLQIIIERLESGTDKPAQLK